MVHRNDGYGAEDFCRTVRKSSLAFSWIFLNGTIEPIDNFSFDEWQFLCYTEFYKFGNVLFIS